MDAGFSKQQDAAEFLTRQFLRHQQFLLAYISTIVLDYHRAEDVLQETAVVLMRRASEFGHTERFWPLAREIARKQAIAMLQKEGKTPHPVPDGFFTSVENAFDRMEPDDAEYHRLLSQCIKRLPELWQVIVRMRYWMQYSVKHIASELERSTNTISVTLSRARSRLAECVSRQHIVGDNA